MAEPQQQFEGTRLLTELSSAMVTIFRESLGKGPDRCKSYWAGSDMLVILLGGGYSIAEQTLFDAGRGSAVRDSRTALHETLAVKMKATVEELTGRKVTAFLSASHQEPDLSAELFVLQPENGTSEELLPG